LLGANIEAHIFLALRQAHWVFGCQSRDPHLARKRGHCTGVMAKLRTRQVGRRMKYNPTTRQSSARRASKWGAINVGNADRCAHQQMQGNGLVREGCTLSFFQALRRDMRQKSMSPNHLRRLCGPKPSKMLTILANRHETLCNWKMNCTSEGAKC
jgi:hypothetical protein